MATTPAIVPSWARPLVIAGALGFAAFALHRYLLGLDAHVWLFSLVFPDYGGDQIPVLASLPVSELCHRVGGAAMLVLGLAQFSTRLRRARPRLHRYVGRTYVVLALVAALTGAVLGVVVPYGGMGETVPALIFASALATTTLIGLARARARAFERHREWMMRSYALAFGPLGVRLVAPLFVYGLAMPERAAIVPSFWLGWLVPVVLAETWIVARRRNTRASARTEPSNLSS